ncbi:hypothetical protein CTheo_8791 [Ceratobasidium theobromae]|uniref:Uncharacterized protein n=1 Tax=Ceratobasidium theobromae TaxID=1582974 RepID=A0A5N5Q8M4_9AGAM|nr:hypothetical protein CTheo_8791 [Ceratobasidium theobromae]
MQQVKNHQLDPGTVMIGDDSGKERPWTIIPRPEKVEKNCNLRKLMELGSNSDSEGEDEAKDAANDIYRSICTSTRHAMNAIIPGAKRGTLKWKQITSAEKAAIHEEVLESNPYLRRFPGGWITEVVMQHQLRNSRDTAARLRKLKAKKSHTSKPIGKSHAPRKGDTAPGALAQATGHANLRQESTRDRSVPANHPESSEEDGPTSKDFPNPPAPVQTSGPNKKAKTLLGYFQPVQAHLSASTKHKKRLGANDTNKKNQTVSNDLPLYTPNLVW